MDGLRESCGYRTNNKQPTLADCEMGHLLSCLETSYHRIDEAAAFLWWLFVPVESGEDVGIGSRKCTVDTSQAVDGTPIACPRRSNSHIKEPTIRLQRFSYEMLA